MKIINRSGIKLVKPTLIHVSQVAPSKVRPGQLSRVAVEEIERVLEVDAFLFTKDGKWYGFNEEETINWLELTPALYQRMIRFSGGINNENQDPN